MRTTRVTREKGSQKSEGFEPLHAVRRNSRGRKATVIAPDDCVALINRNYVYESANDDYCGTLGKAREDVVNSPVAGLWGNKTFDGVIRTCLDRCFAGEKTQHKGWVDLPGQGLRYYHVFYRPYRNGQDEITHAAVALRDLTGRKSEGKALKKSESLLRTALKNVHFGVYSYDLKGRFTFVNDVVVEETGFPREWFLGKSLFDFVRSEERDEVHEHFDTSIRGAPVPPYEFAYHKASGDVSWVQVHTTPMWEKGRVIGVLGVLLNITRRKKSELALREREETYRRLFEDSRDAIFVTDRDGRLTDANAAFLTLFGYASEEIIGLDAVNMYVDHDDREACVRIMNENEFIEDYHLKLKRKDGTVMDCLLTGTARRTDSGRIFAYQGGVKDESGQKRAEEALHDSEQKLRYVVDGSPIPQFVIDKTHTVTHWNRALEKFTGMKAEEMQGTKGHWRAFYRTERPCIADLLLDGAEAQISYWYDGDSSKVETVGGEYKVIHFFPDLGAGGKWLYCTTAVIRDSRNNVIGAVETLQDITEHRLAEDMIQRTEERCRRILEAVSRNQPERKDMAR